VQEPSDALSREELLAMTPEQVLANGLRGSGPHGLAPGLAGTGALALSEQLRADGLPRDALGLASVIFRRAAEQGLPEQRATEQVHAELARNIEVQAGDQPRLHAWLTALARAGERHGDLAAAAAFLGQAHLVWGSVDATRLLGENLPR